MYERLLFDFTKVLTCSGLAVVVYNHFGQLKQIAQMFTGKRMGSEHTASRWIGLL
jgi:hypothetical protein